MFLLISIPQSHVALRLIQLCIKCDIWTGRHNTSKLARGRQWHSGSYWHFDDKKFKENELTFYRGYSDDKFFNVKQLKSPCRVIVKPYSV